MVKRVCKFLSLPCSSVSELYPSALEWGAFAPLASEPDPKDGSSMVYFSRFMKGSWVLDINLWLNPPVFTQILTPGLSTKRHIELGRGHH